MMTVDDLEDVVNHVLKAMQTALREKGCADHIMAEIEKVEPIIISSLARSGVLYHC